jgi:hypothetical protein
VTTEKVTYRLPSGFDPQSHLRALERLIAEKFGEGFEIDFIDPVAGVATASRHVAVTSVSMTSTSQGASREVRLPKDTKPSDGEKVAAKMADEYPDMAMVKFEPFLKRATLSPMDAATKRARDAVAVALSVKPWDISITTRSDGGYDIGLPRTYVPSKHLDKLDEVATAVVGREGWYVETNAQSLTASIIPGDPPTFPPMIAYPLDDPLDSGPDRWARVPLGVTLAEPGADDGRILYADFSMNPHFLASGTTGSGKGIAIMSILAGVLARGLEIEIVDGVKGGVDFAVFMPFVRRSGWADDLASACCVINTTYEEGVRRKHLIKDHHVQKWTQLPKEVAVRPILIVVDELTSLIAPEPMPKGVSKDNPLVAEIMLRNLIKATILNVVGKIARELRFTGISLFCATQVASTTTGIPTELRANLGAKLLLGSKPTDNNRRLALNDPDAVPKVPRNVAESKDGASRGVGVYEFEGQESGVVKTFYSAPERLAEWLRSLGVPETLVPRPSSAEIAAHTPSLEDGSDNPNGPGGEWDLTKAGRTFDPVTGEELHGFERANEQRRLLNGTSEAAAARRLNGD